MIDPFVLLAPVLLLGVVALLGFISCFIKPSRPESDVIVTFDSPPPPGTGVPNSPLNGLYKQIDFKTTGWLWQGPTGLEGANSISFDSGSASPASRQFSFAGGATRVLVRLKVYVQQDGDFTLTDDQSQTFNSGPILATDPPNFYITNFMSASNTFTITSSVGWDLLIDTIVYTGPAL
jgi:hypothetical protein